MLGMFFQFSCISLLQVLKKKIQCLNLDFCLLKIMKLIAMKLTIAPTLATIQQSLRHEQFPVPHCHFYLNLWKRKNRMKAARKGPLTSFGWFVCTCCHCFRLTDCKITEVDRTDTLALWSWFFVTQSRDPAPVHKLTCHVCCQLIKISNEIQTARKAMQSYLPQLIPLVIAASSEVCYMYYYHK